MYLRILLPLLYIIAASGIFIIDVVYVNFSWLSAAVAILLYTKGARGVLVYLQIRSTSPSEDVFTAKYFRLLAGGYFLTAGLSFVSWLRGEGVPGLFLGIATIISTTVWMFAAKRSESSAK
jgi:hypothetical protein